MDCAHGPTASAAAGLARVPAPRADSGEKWAASHSSMQPESCRFNRGPSAFAHRPVVYAQHYDLSLNAAKRWTQPRYGASADYALQDHRCVSATETERIRQCNIDFTFTRRSRH